jgi:multimeric flavodoxin WrbA
MAADIFVLLTPIRLGEKSAVCTQLIERLYSNASGHGPLSISSCRSERG